MYTDVYENPIYNRSSPGSVTLQPADASIMPFASALVIFNQDADEPGKQWPAPPGAEDHNVAMGHCDRILSNYSAGEHVSNTFWSCCNSYIMPGANLLRWPRQLYQDLYDLTTRHDLSPFWTSRCLEHRWGASLVFCQLHS